MPVMTSSTSDGQLAREYVQNGSQDAFAQLVLRYTDYVYSVCRRQVRDAQLAEDVAQAVFVLLARKAAQLTGEENLMGWLFNVARYASANALRQEARRRRHERQAPVRPPAATAEAAWEEIEPELEAALAGLNSRDREVVLLRYYGGMSHHEVATAMKVSEAAAKMRLSRSLTKLRQLLGKRSLLVSAAALTAMMETQAVQAAPTHLSVAIKAAIVNTSTLSVSTAAIVKGTLAIMFWSKVKIAAVVAGILLIGAAAPFVVRGLSTGSGSAPTESTSAAKTALPAQVPGEALDPQRGVALNICRNWGAAGWGPSGTVSPSCAVAYASGHPVFSVMSVAGPKQEGTWLFSLDQPIDIEKYPILSLRYRAKNIDNSVDEPYALWMDDSHGPMGGGFNPIFPSELADDGQEHEIRKDLRTYKPKGPFNGMALRVYADFKQQAQLELLDMRLEAADDSDLVTLPGEEAPLAVKVLDEKQQPVEGVAVIVDAERRNFARQARTGADGVATIDKPLATANGKHRLRIERDGYIAMEMTQDTAGASPIPATLLKAGRLSGQVVDPEGKPVSGVLVEAPADGGTYDRRNWGSGVQSAALTDDQGRWALTLVDTGRSSLAIRFSHADYVSDRSGGQNYKVDLEEMRSGKSIVHLRRGIMLSGIVRNTNGNPVMGATVTQGTDRDSGRDLPATVTDENGRYTFATVEAGKLVLTIQSRGYAPELVETQAQAGMKPMDFVLKFGKVMRFRVVNKDGEPIDKAYVCVESWRGYRTIPVVLQANADGRVTWDSAPEDAVVFTSYAKGYMSVDNKSLVANDEEQVITLPSPLKISGSVTDAQTGEPIQVFTVVDGIQFGGRSDISWQRRPGPTSAPIQNGRYEHTFGYSYPGMLVRIEAEGYQPAISRVFKSDEGAQTFDFKLNKAKVTPIRILTPDGKPAAGAETAVATASEQVVLRNGTIVRENSTAAVTVTNSEGVYLLPSLAEPKGTVLITHGSGYIEMPYQQAAEAKELRLNAWGRVEAMLKVGASVAGQRMSAFRNDRSGQPGEPRLWEQLEGQTDANGRCVFDRVRAGNLIVGNYVQVFENGWSMTHSKPITVEAGGSVSVVIGGEGRPVSGRVEIPADLPGGWRFGAMRISSGRLLTPPPLPDGFQTWPVEKRNAWAEEWKQTDAGKAYMKLAEEKSRNMRSFACPVNADGTFHIEDIPAGMYSAQVSLSLAANNEQLGVATGEFTMPEVPGGKSSEVLDVGVLKVTRQSAATGPTTRPNGAK